MATYFVATNGSDSNTGTSSGAAFRTVAKAISVMTAGDTTRIASGRYAEDLTITHGGSSVARCTLQAFDVNAPPTLRGKLWFRSDGTNTGDYWSLESIRIVGIPNATAVPTTPSTQADVTPVINADHVRFLRCDFTNRDPSIGVGQPGYIAPGSGSYNIMNSVGSGGFGGGTDVEYSHCTFHEIGNWGSLSDLTGNNLGDRSGFFEHSVYSDNSTSLYVHDCVFWRVAGRGVQLYSGNNGSWRFENNLVDECGCGVIIDGNSHNGNLSRNIFTNMQFFGGVAEGSVYTGTANTIDQNWFNNNTGGNYHGFSALTSTNTHTGDPVYTNRSARDYTLTATSPAVGFGPDTVQPLAVTGNRSLLIAPLRWTNGATTYTATITQAQVTAVIAKTNGTYNEASAGAFTGWTATLAPLSTLPAPLDVSTSSVTAIDQAAAPVVKANGFDPASYNTVIYVVDNNSIPADANPGGTNIATRRIWLTANSFTHTADGTFFTNTDPTLNVADRMTMPVPHELGHTLGWLHANSYVAASDAGLFKNTSTLTEYGGHANVMADNWYGVDSTHRIAAGWMTTRVTTVDLSVISSGTTTYTITPLESATGATHTVRFIDPTMREFTGTFNVPVDALDVDYRRPASSSFGEPDLWTGNTNGPMVHGTLTGLLYSSDPTSFARQSLYIGRSGTSPAWAQGTSGTTAGGHLTLTATTVTSGSVTLTAVYTKPSSVPAAPSVTSVTDSFGASVANGGSTTHNPVTVVMSAPGAGYIIPLIDGVDVTDLITSGGVRAKDDNTVTFQVPPTLTAGAHSLTATAVNLAGASTASVARTWTITGGADTTRPTTVINTGPANPTTDPVAVFTFSATDPDDATLTSEYSLDANPTYITCTSPFSITVPPGNHNVRIRSRDAAGNTDGAPPSWSWTLNTIGGGGDVNPPTTTILTGPAAVTPTTNATFTYSVSDADYTSPGLYPSGNTIPHATLLLNEVFYTEARLDGGAWVHQTTNTVTYPGPLAAGSHTFQIRSTDPAGNVETARSWTWTIGATDTQEPVTTITQAPSGSSTVTQATFAFTATDPDTATGLISESNLDGQGWVTRTSPFTIFNVPIGSHTMQIRTRDPAGNIESSPPSATWTVTPVIVVTDTTPPIVTITGGPADGAALNTNSALYTFAAVDPDDAAGTLNYQISVDGSPFIAVTSPYLVSNLNDGSHTFSVRAYDAAANFSNVVTRGFTVATQVVVVGSNSADVAFFLETTPTNTGSADVSFFLDLPVTPPGGGGGGSAAGRPVWGEFCGVEFANIARVREYLAAGLGGARWEVTDSLPCSVLYRLGAYSDPAVDGAPWFDVQRGESAEFLGVIFNPGVLVDQLGSISSRSVSDIATTFGGAAIGPMRRGAREFHFDAEIIAASQAGADYGLAWLSQVLNDTALCDPCSLCSLELRLSCPPDDGSADETGRWFFYDVACTAGPTAGDLSEVDCAAILPVTFTLTAGKPYRYKPLTPIVEPRMLRQPSQATGCMSFDQWLCGQDNLSTITAPLLSPRVGTIGTRVTIQSGSGVGPIAVELYDVCPSVPVDPALSRGGLVLRGLAAGEGFVIDSSLHIARHIAADGTVTDGSPYLIPVSQGEALVWSEVESCDASACFVVRGLHPCSGGEDTAILVEAQAREA